MSGFARAVADAALLRRGFFAEVAAHPSAIGQALLVVLLSAAAAGAGALGEGGRALAAEVATRIVLGAAGWLVGTTAAFVVVAKALRPPEGRRVDWGMLGRAFGFAHAPGLVRVLGAVPEVRAGVLVLSLAWQLVALIVALREVAGYRAYWKAAAVLFIAFLPYAAAMYALGLLF